MKLFELFEAPPLDVVDGLRDRLLDLITPLAANNVPYVSVQQVVDKLSGAHSGVMIDRALILAVLDPEKCKMVKSIEGDRIYLGLASPDKNASSKEDEEKKAKEFQHKAGTQAKKEISGENNPAPTNPLG